MELVADCAVDLRAPAFNWPKKGLHNIVESFDLDLVSAHKSADSKRKYVIAWPAAELHACSYN